MLQEQLLGVVSQVVAGLAGSVKLGEEGKRLPPHRLLDQGGLAEPGPAEHLKEPVGFGLDASLASGPGDGRPQPVAGQPGGPCLGGPSGQPTCLLGVRLPREPHLLAQARYPLHDPGEARPDRQPQETRFPRRPATQVRQGRLQGAPRGGVRNQPPQATPRGRHEIRQACSPLRGSVVGGLGHSAALAPRTRAPPRTPGIQLAVRERALVTPAPPPPGPAPGRGCGGPRGPRRGTSRRWLPGGGPRHRRGRCRRG